MMGFLLLLFLGLATLALLWLLKLRGPVLTLSAAALAFGGAGYAIQGHPGAAGSPRSMSARPAPPSLAGARQALMGRFTAADRWLIISDSFASRGNSKDAVGILQSALREHPQDYALWVGLGNALSDHARTITPAARFAYARADELAPGYPAPRFFLGLALARSGQPQEAATLWREVLADAPADASWRPMVEEGLAAIDEASNASPTAPKL